MNGTEFLNLTAKEKAQAESFFKVLVSKRYDVSQMANVMYLMGAMLVKHAEEANGHLTEANEADIRFEFLVIPVCGMMPEIEAKAKVLHDEYIEAAKDA